MAFQRGLHDCIAGRTPLRCKVHYYRMTTSAGVVNCLRAPFSPGNPARSLDGNGSACAFAEWFSPAQFILNRIRITGKKQNQRNNGGQAASLKTSLDES